MKWESIQCKICSQDIEADENGDIYAINALYLDQSFQRVKGGEKRLIIL